jgi:hypothetical protein
MSYIFEAERSIELDDKNTKFHSIFIESNENGFLVSERTYTNQEGYSRRPRSWSFESIDSLIMWLRENIKCNCKS